MNKTRATWDKVEYATMYELRLYRDGSLIQTVDSTSSSIDLGDYITSEGTYYYEVRAKGRDAGERKYLLTGDYAPSDETLTVNQEVMERLTGAGRIIRKAENTGRKTAPILRLSG